ncbi:MAG: non-ribosomal peptide synthetase, partial [Psychrosphaera sp.]|nr:non-ribosomal peptide synthetase [Psychrosphaera sp.]
TGLPKGVMIEHRNTVCFIDWATRYFSAEELSCVLASTSLNFDLSIFEMFVPLSGGHCVVIVKNILSLADSAFVNPGLTLINTVPSGIGALVDEDKIPSSVKVINLAGEVLKKTLVDNIQKLSPMATVVNLYGPSEDTTYSTVMSMPSNGDDYPTIGTPVDNTVVYILDENQQLQPHGCIGELYIGGECLARGYHNMPQLTAERFVQNPFNTDPQSRLYRTGDLVRYRPDDSLEFIGRADAQVKVRGFRIELGEIEHRLLQDQGVQSAVLLVRQEQIVAYVVGEVKVATLRTTLQAQLPDYMVPSLFVELDELPLLPNGKTDTNALLAMDHQSLSAYVGPQSADETQQVQVWAELLGLPVDKVSVTANFFELGGNSILLLRLISLLAKVGIKRTIKQVYEQPTIRGLSKAG